MAWIKDIEVGTEITLDLTPMDLVEVVNQTVKVTVLYKRGRQCRLAIDAPKHVQLEVSPPDGVTLAHEQAS